MWYLFHFCSSASPAFDSHSDPPRARHPFEDNFFNNVCLGFLWTRGILYAQALSAQRQQGLEMDF